MPEMKNSGIEWIGEIPSHWAVLRNKYNFDLNKNIVGTAYKDTQLLSLTKNGVKAITEDDQKGKVPTSFATYQTVDKDDIVMCLFDLDVSAVFSGISPYEGMISPAYKCFKCKEHLFPQYIDYYFRTVFVDRKYKRYSKNVRYSIGTDEFMALPILVPPLEVQKSIANFLDQKCSEIDSLSADIQSQIDVLEEYKKSVITEAVTKGLNPDVEMKNSGIELIGMIPAHWAIKRTKYIANSLSKGNGITKEQVFDDGDIQCVRYGEIYSKYEQSFDKTLSSTKLNQITSPKHIQYGDILFAGTGELIEEIGKNIVFLGTEPCLAGGDIVVLKHSQNPRFLNYALNSTYSQEQKSKGKAKLKVVHISATDIGNILITLPPIAEQDAIAEFLDKTCNDIDMSIADKKAQLETLAEYKKSLIYEYVTGKKEVPENV